MATIKQISIELIELVAHQLAIETMSWDESIPAFDSRFLNKLESCIITPFQKFNKLLLYKGLTGKAAILFYLLIKNHPFQNGNKRIAVTTLLIFLYLNNKWLSIDNTQLYKLALFVAESPAEAKDEMIVFLERIIKRHCVKMRPSEE